MFCYVEYGDNYNRPHGRHWGGPGGRRPPPSPKEKENKKKIKKKRKKRKKTEKREKRKKGTMNNVKLLHMKCCFFPIFQ